MKYIYIYRYSAENSYLVLQDFTCIPILIEKIQNELILPTQQLW